MFHDHCESINELIAAIDQSLQLILLLICLNDLIVYASDRDDLIQSYEGFDSFFEITGFKPQNMLKNDLLLLLDCSINIHLLRIPKYHLDLIYVILSINLLSEVCVAANDLLGTIVLYLLIRFHIDTFLVKIRLSLKNVLHVGLLINLYLFFFLVFMDIKIVNFWLYYFLFNFRLDIFLNFLCR